MCVVDPVSDSPAVHLVFQALQILCDLTCEASPFEIKSLGQFGNQVRAVKAPQPLPLKLFPPRRAAGSWQTNSYMAPFLLGAPVVPLSGSVCFLLAGSELRRAIFGRSLLCPGPFRG